MPNPTDQDRIDATTKNGVVISLDSYRANAGAPSTAIPLSVASLMQLSNFWVVVGAICILAFFLHGRR